MRSDSETRSPLLRFLDHFLQDGNIVWMLGIGTAIFVGSSLFLVARHWAEATPLWKYGILLTYTCGMYGAGEFARRRLALRRTSTVLQALTIVRLPITFVALRWVGPDGTGVPVCDLRPHRMAGAVVAASAFSLAKVEADPGLRRIAWAFVDWLALSLVVQATAPEAGLVAALGVLAAIRA